MWIASLFLSFTCLAPVAAPITREDTELTQLLDEMDWLFTADAAADFAADRRAGRVRFLGMTGQAPVIPPLGLLRHLMCYSRYAELDFLSVGSCFILGEEHLKLRHHAYDYVKQYNTLIISHLEAQGLSECSDRVDWDGAWDAVSEYLEGRWRDKGTLSMGHEAIRVYLNDFSNHVRSAKKVCKILRKKGLDRGYQVIVSPRDIINTDRADDTLYKMTCTPSHEN